MSTNPRKAKTEAAETPAVKTESAVTFPEPSMALLTEMLGAQDDGSIHLPVSDFLTSARQLLGENGMNILSQALLPKDGTGGVDGLAVSESTLVFDGKKIYLKRKTSTGHTSSEAPHETSPRLEREEVSSFNNPIVRDLVEELMVISGYRRLGYDYTDSVRMELYGKKAAQIYKQESKEGSRPLRMGMVDLVGLSYINAEYGDGAGDLALQSIAESIRKHYGNDLLLQGRRGDEFYFMISGDNQHPLPQVTMQVTNKLGEHKEISLTLYQAMLPVESTGLTDPELLARVAHHPEKLTDYLRIQLEMKIEEEKAEAKDSFIQEYEHKAFSMLYKSNGVQEICRDVLPAFQAELTKKYRVPAKALEVLNRIRRFC